MKLVYAGVMYRLASSRLTFLLLACVAWACSDARGTPAEEGEKVPPGKPSDPVVEKVVAPPFQIDIGLDSDDSVDVGSCPDECGVEAQVTLRFAGESPVELKYSGRPTTYYPNQVDCDDLITAAAFGCDTRRFYLQASSVSRAHQLAQGGAGGEEAVSSSAHLISFYLYRKGLSGLYTDPQGESWFLRHAPESLVPESIVLSEPGQGIVWSGEVIGERTSDGTQMRFNVSIAACVAPPSVCVG